LRFFFFGASPLNWSESGSVSEARVRVTGGMRMNGYSQSVCPSCLMSGVAGLTTRSVWKGKELKVVDQCEPSSQTLWSTSGVDPLASGLRTLYDVVSYAPLLSHCSLQQSPSANAGFPSSVLSMASEASPTVFGFRPTPEGVRFAPSLKLEGLPLFLLVCATAVMHQACSRAFRFRLAGYQLSKLFLHLP
jgi:hypothetical protein